MINVNLLPDSLKKKDGISVPLAVGVVVALAILGFLGSMVLSYTTSVIPDLRARQESLERRKTSLSAQVEELKKINAEIAKLTSYVDTVKSLYRQRIIWAKILSDIKHIVNFDPAMSEYNSEMRYLWLTNISCSRKNITLMGYATAPSQVMAMQMPERLIQTFLSYTPATLPEKDEETRLQEELRRAIEEYEAERRDNPNLPIQGARELTIRQRLEEIKNIKSGGIAMAPFHTFLMPGSLQLRSASWTGAPSVPTSQEIFPSNAWVFNLIMNLK